LAPRKPGGTAAADTLFSNINTGMQAPAPTTPEALFRSRKTSILSAVADGYKRLSKRVPAEDRVRLDAHAEQVRELEALVSGGGDAASCSKPALSLPSGYKPSNIGQMDASAAAHIENTVMALACNLAPVVTLQFVEYQNPNFSSCSTATVRPCCAATGPTTTGTPWSMKRATTRTRPASTI
jgi:hypothetical protein